MIGPTVANAQAFGQRGTAAIADADGEHDELLAAPAEQRIGGAHASTNAPDERLEYGVPHEVTMNVIYAFEMIDVEQDQGDGLVRSCGPAHFHSNRPFELGPIPGAR